MQVDWPALVYPVCGYRSQALNPQELKQELLCITPSPVCPGTSESLKWSSDFGKVFHPLSGDSDHP